MTTDDSSPSPQRPSIFVLPDPGQAVDPAEQLRLLWRERATVEGVCPVCHAEVKRPGRAQRRALERRWGKGVQHAVMEHESSCPVGGEA